MKRIISKSNLRFFLISILILSVFVRCDDNETPFPQVSIYASLALDSQLGNMLPGESKTIDNYGIGGLIIYRLDQNTFLAFDRACTYETSRECVVNHDGGNTYECSCCGSQFQILQFIDSPIMVIQGPANYPLQQYNCLFNGINTVTVTN